MGREFQGGEWGIFENFFKDCQNHGRHGGHGGHGKKIKLIGEEQEGNLSEPQIRGFRRL